MTRVLTIEDDEITAKEIMAELSTHGFEVTWAATGRDGLAQASSQPFDVITLDRMLPDIDGLEVVTFLRASGIDTPILMISALSDVDERIRGLRAGGDDYLTKPFVPDEMAARLEVMLRRRKPAASQSKLKVQDLELDLIARIAHRGTQKIRLSPTEFRLLEYLMRNSSQVVTRTMIFEAVWGYSFDPGTNVVDVHVTGLRRKIDPEEFPPLLRTVRGAGYVLG
ncbi:two-component system [Novimethylophilus kurashikiensis]|uniref:Two-component system n=1 Tax=Novimethylophilus kurashikiensis TaxID=1825523 RepID=A0A2R5F429_9PROT|nr:response regulator transcription factor [Novimethylophilus kurashikiensis]GBG13210.1 two-component system [Novimethylophilus kurashikiensis]